MAVLTTHIDTLDRQWDGADILKKRTTTTKGSCTAGEVPGYCFPQASLNKLNQGERNV